MLLAFLSYIVEFLVKEYKYFSVHSITFFPTFLW